MNRTASWTIALLLGAVPALALTAATAREEFEAVLRRTADPVRGGTLFDTCAACHQRDGSGVADGTVPAIAGQHYRVIVRQLVDFRHDRRWDIRMEHFVDRHRLANPQDLADLAAYASGLPRARHPGAGDAELIEQGAFLYAQRCGSCHGPAAEGDAVTLVPRLSGQHAAYLARQIYDAVDGRRPNMGGEHARRLEALERADILAVTEYLSRLPRAASTGHEPSSSTSLRRRDGRLRSLLMQRAGARR